MELRLRKQYILTMLTALIFLGACFLIARFAGGMQARRGAVIATRDRIASIEATREVLAKEAKELERINQRATALEQYVVTESTIPSLLSNLEAVASSNHVGFSIVSVQNTPGKKLAISMRGRGAYSNLEAFLAAMDQQPYLVRFTSFDIRNDGIAAAEDAPLDAAAPREPMPKVSGGWSMDAILEVVSY